MLNIKYLSGIVLLIFVVILIEVVLTLLGIEESLVFLFFLLSYSRQLFLPFPKSFQAL